MKPVTQERAERIAKAHACERCGEYSYKQVSVKTAPKDQQESLGIVWSVEKVCGVCDASQELGIAEDGTIVFVS